MLFKLLEPLQYQGANLTQVLSDKRIDIILILSNFKYAVKSSFLNAYITNNTFL